MFRYLLLLFISVLSAAEKPNVIIFYCDDLGMGDIKAYDSSSTIPTPNIDQLAAEGILFNNVHASAAVCTPSRYGLLTGTYPHRSRAKGAILRSAYDAPLLSPSDKLLGTVFQQAGYKTAAFGKWHLGMKWTNKNGDGVARPKVGTSIFSTRDVDFSKPIIEGPNQYGFDYFFGIGSSINHGPYCFIENNRVTEIPAELRKEISVNGRAYREGWKSSSWKDDGQGETISDAALSFMQNQHKKNTPFFMYYAAVAPHWPWVPPKTIAGIRVKGEGGSDDNNSPRNDMVFQNDVIVGRFLKFLEDPDGDGSTEDSIRKNTLIIFTSDNGADIGAFSKLKGKKASIYEAGHRIPFIVNWPGTVEKSLSETLFSQVDLYASLAHLIGVKAATVDSINMLPALLGKEKMAVRPPVLVTDKGQSFAVIDKNWKLIIKKKKPAELYDLEKDPLEARNMISNYPEKVSALFKFFQQKLQ